MTGKSLPWEGLGAEHQRQREGTTFCAAGPEAGMERLGWGERSRGTWPGLAGREDE